MNYAKSGLNHFHGRKIGYDCNCIYRFTSGTFNLNLMDMGMVKVLVMEWMEGRIELMVF
jgi:hypothetical protein